MLDLENVTMRVTKYRIVEWTSVFKDGSKVVAYELQCQSESNPEKWTVVGTSLSLADARKALLFHSPNHSCGSG